MSFNNKYKTQLSFVSQLSDQLPWLSDLRLYQLIGLNYGIETNYNHMASAFEFLDKSVFTYPTMTEIRQRQLETLRVLSNQGKAALDKKELQTLNNFFTVNGQFLNPQSIQTIDNTAAQKEVNKAAQTVVKTAASMFTTLDTITYTGTATEKVSQLKKVEHSYKKLLRNLGMGKRNLKKTTLIENVGELDADNVGEALKHIWHYKGLALEELGVQKLAQIFHSYNNEMESKEEWIIPVNVGTKLDSSKKSSITDIALFKLKDITVNANGQVELETLDLGKSLLNIQAKSGEKQIPWNVSSKRTHVSLNDLAVSGKGQSNKYYSELKSMYILDKQKSINMHGQPVKIGPLFDKYKPDVYNALGNYLISNGLAKILHLGSDSSKEENQILLTRNGFQTYYDRIYQDLAASSGPIFVFAKSITLRQSNFLTQLRAVTMRRK